MGLDVAAGGLAHGLMPFVPEAARCFLPVGETGVCNGKGVLRDPKRNEIAAFGNFVCRFGWKPLGVR